MSESAMSSQSTQGTQRGPGTGPSTVTISGVKVEFPCKAYPSQMAMMSKVIQGLKTGKNCLLESPTGSGKSLALLCSALAWQRHEAARVTALNAEIDARHEAAMEQHRLEQREKRQPAEQLQKEANTTMTNDVSKTYDDDSSFDVSFDTLTPTQPVYDITDDEDEDFKPSKRTRISGSSNAEQGNSSMSLPTGLKNSRKDIRTNSDAQQTSGDENSPYFVPAEKKLTVPKIFFGTRTHKQIAQITRELRKTSYRNVRSVVLASREHTCVNPAVEKLPNKNELCRELVQNGMESGNGCLYHPGARKLSSFGALSAVGLTPGFDVEDLVVIGRRHKACPYYVTRFLMQNADIIFCPYNYLIDPVIRKSMNLELEGHVLIFDEAHNMEDASRESSSFSIKQDDLTNAMQDCEKVIRFGNEPFAHGQLSKFLSTLSQWMDSMQSLLVDSTFNNACKCWNGNEFLGSMHAAGMTEENIQMHTAYFQKIMELRDKQMEAFKERGTRWHDDKPMLATQTIVAIESVFRLFGELCRDNGRVREDFRVALSRDIARRRRDGNSGPMKVVQVLTLHLWCLNPAVAFEFIRKNAHAIVLTSGTLSPMTSFESELGTLFPLKLEASHVIDRSQCWAAVIGTGPNGINLNGSYANASTIKFQDEIGTIVFRVCQSVPHGVLCFLPSYKMLENLVDRWRITGLYDQIEALKTVVLEPRSGIEAFQGAMDEFYAAIAASSKNGRRSEMNGALFLAVCRGKVSEGLDFADNNARAVICVGIPFPNVKDMQVELKRAYNTNNKSRGLLEGGMWYEIQAFRALNQALGRCIRHRNDWGSILLVDDRYVRNPRYIQSLSKWIRSSVQQFKHWGSLENGLREFCNGMLNSENYLMSQTGSFAEELGGESPCLENSTSQKILATAALGMKGQNNTAFGKENSDIPVVPFANSFSSSVDSNEDDIILLEQSKGNSTSLVDSSPSSRTKNDTTNSDFKLPSTPLNIFSRKTNRADKKSPQNSMIASMFARQVKRNSDRLVGGFSPNDVSFETDEGSVSDDNSNRNKKRPREKKLKL